MNALVEKMRVARESTVEVAPGKALTMRRPLAAHMHTLRAGITAELVVSHVTAWSGITEADLLPPGVGSSDVAAFSPELATEVLLDKPEWLEPAMKKLVELVNTWFEQRAAAAKN